MADGSDEPEIVDRMVELARGGADLVAASRYMKGGRQIGGPLLKRLMSRVAGLTLHWFARVPTHDPTNNFKLYSRRFLESTEIESTAGFELALELTVKATLAKRRIAEIPTTWRDRTAGQSNFKLRKWLPALPALVPRRVPAPTCSAPPLVTPRRARMIVPPIPILAGNQVRLFLTSATLLFVELLLIRWIPANVIYVGYFSNFVLIASFLGIGLGILLGRAQPTLPDLPVRAAAVRRGRPRAGCAAEHPGRSREPDLLRPRVQHERRHELPRPAADHGARRRC